ncbi:MAG: hypothetical protein HY286_08225 [Planctomycetes bacterium]|nr:hypothetical protein [Planctomycetota bacterium]
MRAVIFILLIVAPPGCLGARAGMTVERDGRAAIIKIERSLADTYELAIAEIRSRGAVESSSLNGKFIEGRSRSAVIRIEISDGEQNLTVVRVNVNDNSAGPDLPGSEDLQIEIARSIAVRSR